MSPLLTVPRQQSDALLRAIECDFEPPGVCCESAPHGTSFVAPHGHPQRSGVERTAVHREEGPACFPAAIMEVAGCATFAGAGCAVQQHVVARQGGGFDRLLQGLRGRVFKDGGGLGVGSCVEAGFREAGLQHPLSEFTGFVVNGVVEGVRAQVAPVTVQAECRVGGAGASDVKQAVAQV